MLVRDLMNYVTGEVVLYVGGDNSEYDSEGFVKLDLPLAGGSEVKNEK